MSHSRIVADDTIVLFADLQEGIGDRTLTVTHGELKKGVLALAKLARLYDIPAIVTAVPSQSGAPEIFKEIAEGYGELPVHVRFVADSFRDDSIASFIRESGRKTVLLSGVATELAVQLPALTGIDLGYRTFVVVDACGGVSERTEHAALSRIVQHGGSIVSVMTLAGELTDDFRSSRGGAAVEILYAMATP